MLYMFFVRSFKMISPSRHINSIFWASSFNARGGGMLVVSLMGVNFEFWSHLGCSGQNAIIFSREGLV